MGLFDRRRKRESPLGEWQVPEPETAEPNPLGGPGAGDEGFPARGREPWT